MVAKYDYFYTKRNTDDIESIIMWAVDRINNKSIAEEPYVFGVYAALDFLFGNDNLRIKSCRGEFNYTNLQRCKDISKKHKGVMRTYNEYSDLTNPKHTQIIDDACKTIRT